MLRKNIYIHSIPPAAVKLMGWVLLYAIIVTEVSCKKMVDVKPPSTSINSGNVFSNDETAIAAITNIYVSITSKTVKVGGISSLSLFPALSADELSLYSGATNNSVFYYYTNSLSNNNLNSPDFWVALYQTIYLANDALEGLQKSSKLTAAVKDQLSGEAKFIRAFCYYYLVNLYGDVALPLTTDYTINATLPRLPKSQVNQQIISDLKDAQSLLSPDFLGSTLLNTTAERVRPTKWAATALLAREYLFTGDYANAEIQAGLVINASYLFSLASLDNVFLKNSSEAIWQLQPVNAGWNTEDARIFLLPPSGPNSTAYPVFLSPFLLNSFEPGDQRKVKWTNNVSIQGTTYYYPFKYKNAAFNNPVTEYQMVLRLAEQYLIRAEARTTKPSPDFAGAKADIDAIRSRAGLSGYTGSLDATSLMNAIIHERQVELFTEWGHRWFDLKRTGTIDAVMKVVTPQKGGAWSTNWQWYPISRNELLLNPKLVQNTGY